VDSRKRNGDQQQEFSGDGILNAAASMEAEADDADVREEEIVAWE
jgi:hypothetical protein